MPVHRGKDKEGTYYQWGDHGKKYYYIARVESMRIYAKQKALTQGQAIHANVR